MSFKIKTGITVCNFIQDSIFIYHSSYQSIWRCFSQGNIWPCSVGSGCSCPDGSFGHSGSPGHLHPACMYMRELITNAEKTKGFFDSHSKGVTKYWYGNILYCFLLWYVDIFIKTCKYSKRIPPPRWPGSLLHDSLGVNEREKGGQCR